MICPIAVIFRREDMENSKLNKQNEERLAKTMNPEFTILLNAIT